MRTTSQSESTRVPPVTALRSPPASRMTGALSPVIALSSTEATPSTISPSLGMNSPASTRTRSPLRSVGAGGGREARRRRVEAAVVRRAVELLRATTSRRALRSASACALPRPSAIASAKLAKSTVNQSQSETARMNQAGASPLAERAPGRRGRVVRTLPTSTTNITGLRTWWRGSSLRNDVDDRAAHDLGVEERTGLGVCGRA